ncbi:MAG: hypothetical protein IT559_07000 [Alphaproteobacteria bacterium]|nr:hypothetical protein [Alphaproteobacteria bacterium]
MGSLASRPSVPSYPSPQIVYVPQPAPAAPPPQPASSGAAPSPGDQGGNGSSGTATPAPSPEKSRQTSLLARDRGRFGTIQTGFRGLLETAFGNNQRKTLLGE